MSSNSQLPLLYQRTRRYNPSTKRYTCGRWTIEAHRPDASDLDARSKSIVLPLQCGTGSTMIIYPNLIKKEDRDDITNEILQYRYPSPDDTTTSSTSGRTEGTTPGNINDTASNCNSKAISNASTTKSYNESNSQVKNDNDDDYHRPSLFRQYQIQASHEPRLNCLLHTKMNTTGTSSTNHYDTESLQPGYRYGRITMKARSYENLPRTLQFTKEMELLYGQTQNDVDADASEAETNEAVFNIGAHVLLYRDAHDSMGFHADNAQEESYILTAIMSQEHIRMIVVKPKAIENVHEDEIQYKLELREGDAYSMNGSCACFCLFVICSCNWVYMVLGLRIKHMYLTFLFVLLHLFARYHATTLSTWRSKRPQSYESSRFDATTAV